MIHKIWSHKSSLKLCLSAPTNKIHYRFTPCHNQLIGSPIGCWPNCPSDPPGSLYQNPVEKVQRKRHGFFFWLEDSEWFCSTQNFNFFVDQLTKVVAVFLNFHNQKSLVLVSGMKNCLQGKHPTSNWHLQNKRVFGKFWALLNFRSSESADKNGENLAQTFGSLKWKFYPNSFLATSKSGSAICKWYSTISTMFFFSHLKGQSKTFARKKKKKSL